MEQQQVDKGGPPFSAVIVNPQGRVNSEGVNVINSLHDSTAHAEIQAIRAAGRTLGHSDLTGNTLFASGKPCGLCYMAIRLARITPACS